MDVIETDAEGYLRDLSQWSRDVAEGVARDAGVTLGPDHWRLIGVVRDFYRETGVSPAMPDRASMKRLFSYPASSLTRDAVLSSTTKM